MPGKDLRKGAADAAVRYCFNPTEENRAALEEAASAYHDGERRRRREARKRNYAKAKRRLLEEMGGVCATPGCGKRRGLEFHHPYHRGWVAAKTSRWVRLARYRREWKLGLIDLRCRKCNASHKYEAHKQEVPF